MMQFMLALNSFLLVGEVSALSIVSNLTVLVILVLFIKLFVMINIGLLALSLVSVMDLNLIRSINIKLSQILDHIFILLEWIIDFFYRYYDLMIFVFDIDSLLIAILEIAMFLIISMMFFVFIKIGSRSTR